MNQHMTPAASVEVGRVTSRQCQVERMLAHAITADVRVKRFASPGEAPARRPA